MREAARLVSSYISSAKARAIETGRPAGVMIQRYSPATIGSASAGAITLPQHANTLVMVEVPPMYAGDTLTSTAVTAPLTMSLTWSGVTYTTTPFACLTSLPYDVAWQGLIRVGDMIRFGYQGRWYTIIGTGIQSGGGTSWQLDPTYQPGSVITPQPSTSYSAGPPATAPWVLLATDGSRAMPPPPPPSAATPGYPYQILRQPTKSAVQPLQLPEDVVVDLSNSGVGAVAPAWNCLGGAATPGQQRCRCIPIRSSRSPPLAALAISTASTTRLPRRGRGEYRHQRGQSAPAPDEHAVSADRRREGMADVSTTGTDLNLTHMSNMWVAIARAIALVVTTENANSTVATNSFGPLINAGSSRITPRAWEGVNLIARRASIPALPRRAAASR